MVESWESRVAAVWAVAESTPDESVLVAIDALVAERGADDAAALFEAASVRDYLSREAEAEPLYREAITAGLDAERHPQAVIQLASTLRNMGRPAEAVDLLNDLLAEHASDEWTAPAAAFLALSLASDGRERDAASVALYALADSLPVYSSAVKRYALELR
jgi:tetratricopeptide (TPR) repeat protein